ncbi:MAG: DNA helicase UvrD, partial [Thermoplasmata archaeon]
YKGLVGRFGSEFNILLKMSEEDLRRFLPSKIAEGIIRVREGNVNIHPGYDGEYGKIEIFSKDDKDELQLTLF